MGGVNMGGVMNKPLAEILQQLEREFGQQRRPDQNQKGPVSRSSGSMRLQIDTIETDDAVWFFTDIPGLEKSELQVCHLARGLEASTAEALSLWFLMCLCAVSSSAVGQP